MATFLGGFVQALQDKDKRDFTREMFMEESAERRRTSLLTALGNRKSTSEDAAKFAPHLAWVESRLGGVEGSEEFLAGIASNPSEAARIRGKIEEAEQAQAEKDFTFRLEGSDFMNAFPLIGANLNNPERMATFKSTADIFTSVLDLSTEDLMDDDTFSNLFGEVRTGAPVSTVTADINASVLNRTIDIQRYDQQFELFNSTVSSLISEDINALFTSDNVGAARALEDARSNLGKDGSEDSTNSLYSKYAERAFETMKVQDVPFFDGIEQNPRILLAREKARIANQPSEEITTTTLPTSATASAEELNEMGATVVENDLPPAALTHPIYNDIESARVGSPEGGAWVRTQGGLKYEPVAGTEVDDEREGFHLLERWKAFTQWEPSDNSILPTTEELKAMFSLTPEAIRARKAAQ